MRQLNWRSLMPHAAFLFVYILWGINVSSMKVGGKEWDALVFNGMRFLSMAPPLIAYTYWYYRAGRAGRTARQAGHSKQQTLPMDSWRLSGKDWLWIAILGLLTAAQESVLAYGVQYSSTANASVLGRGLTPIVTAVLALAMHEMKLSWRLVVGVPVAFIGVVLMMAGSGLHFGLDTLRGDLLLISRSLIGAVYLIMMSRLVKRYPLILLLTLEIAFAALWLSPFVIMRVDLAFLAAMSNQGWLSLVYTATLATVAGFFLHNWALGKLGPFHASAYGFLLPLTAALAGITLLGESINTGQIIGAIVVLLAMYLVQRDRMEQTLSSGSRLQTQPDKSRKAENQSC